MAGGERGYVRRLEADEAERRGADPWQEDDFSELETVLKVRGYDTEDVRRFME